jgi:hypothetical protein
MRRLCVHHHFNKGERMKYRVAWTRHSTNAKTKAWVTFPTDNPKGNILEFEAPTHKAAMAYCQANIIRGDNRLLMGRTNIHFCAVKEGGPNA